jgi:hypothetical protein
MKTLALAVTASALIALAGGQAFAKPVHVQKTAKLTIVMHDPGCHWFSIGGKFKTTASVAGPVKLTNHDEATLKVSGVGAVKRIPVGKQLLLGTGHYVITMVGQAPDDNHLKLTVS